MDHPHGGSLSLPQFAGKTKILLAEWPGKVGLLIADGKEKSKRFKGAHEALDWCVKNHVSFYLLSPAPVAQN